MEATQTILLCFSGLFTFAFGLGWILPLVAAGFKEAKPKKSDSIYELLDLLLIVFDCIPFFWVLRAIPETPSAYRAARDTWQREGMIRSVFWLSMIFLTITAGILLFPI